MTNRLINRNTKTITFSLPPEMAEQVQDVMRDEGRTMSELIREALDEYLGRHADARRADVLRAAAGLWADRTDLAQLDEARATLDRDLSR